MTTPIEIDQYTSVIIEDQGKYGWAIKEGRIYQGEFKPNWCAKEFGPKDKKTTKNVPVSVKLGPKEKAIEVLKALLYEIQGGASEYVDRSGIRQEVNNPADDADDIPF